VAAICIIAIFYTIPTNGPAVNAQTPQIKPNAARLLAEFNRWRNAIGIHSYQEDIRLSMSVQFHTDDMIGRRYFHHDAPFPINCNGFWVSTFDKRAACFGTWGAGEGLHAGSTDPAKATLGWITSTKGHCLGVMESTTTHMGGACTHH
jgi:uncharacterized protein YkwD